MNHLAPYIFALGAALALASLARDARRLPSLLRELSRQLERL
jgi:hypothetical protein